LLATGTFTGGTASGWQQLNFSTPVTIAANTTYVASYHTRRPVLTRRRTILRRWERTTRRFTRSGIGVDGLNGVYAYGAGGIFPKPRLHVE
jgi:hypothetical protein